MKQNIMSLLVYLLIGLAVIGVITALFTNAVGFITSLLLSVLIGATIFGLIYFFILRKRTPNDIRKYRKAVKQSKQKYKYNKHKKMQPSPIKQNISHKKMNRPLKNSRKDAPQLRVIEGNKQKKKNRASL
ncbi:SA1362 family protein [Gracilibacillus massiliensis]|uniref:SA1362 family protein n=1 Tax=Gracilibacillus massiliensis TaxID=1564956 RepID=UPI00071CC541|nr:SA1362 family protein [Gracilibacillus massiliensis]